jgi:hypothetical protein
MGVSPRCVQTNPSDKARKPHQYDRSGLPPPPPVFTVVE